MLMKKVLLSISIVALGACSSTGANDEACLMDGRGAKMERVFVKSDLDADGKLSLDEYTKHREARIQRKGQGRMKKMKTEDVFKMMDTNNDGFVTKDEMQAHWKSKKRGRRHARKGQMNN